PSSPASMPMRAQSRPPSQQPHTRHPGTPVLCRKSGCLDSSRSGTITVAANREFPEGQGMENAARSKPDLLIVDDDPLISDTLNFVLGRDFNVYVAESREQMKSLLRQLESPP